MPLKMPYNTSMILHIIYFRNEIADERKGTSNALVTIWELLEYTLPFLTKGIQNLYHDLENVIITGKIEGKRRRGRKRPAYISSLSKCLDLSNTGLWKATSFSVFFSELC